MGVDGTFMKHGLYDSTMLLLVGNNNNVTIAVGLCNSENGQNCAWFIQHCITSGLSQLSIPVFIDRGTSLISALEGAQFLNIFYCTRHILGNVKSIFRGLVTSDIERLVWALQASDSEEEYEARLVALGVTHPTIADYLKSIPVERWVLYCNLSKTKLYGWRTTNFVESQNSAALEIRQQHPFTVFSKTIERWMVDRFKCDQDVASWKTKSYKVTPYATTLLEEHEAIVGYYSVAPSTPDVAFVIDTRHASSSRRRVDVDAKVCTCSFMGQYGIPCRHFIAALKFFGHQSELYSAFASCYLVDEYHRGYGASSGSIELVLPEDISCLKERLPPMKKTNKGRPKRKRIASQREF